MRAGGYILLYDVYDVLGDHEMHGIVGRAYIVNNTVQPVDKFSTGTTVTALRPRPAALSVSHP